MKIIQDRRTFVAGLSAAGVRRCSAFARPLPQRSRPGNDLRPSRRVAAPSARPAGFLAGELMRADGITDVSYVTGDTSVEIPSGSLAATRISA